MELIWIVGGFVIGVVLFLLVNQLFEVYYFGFKGMSSTFMGCWIAGAVIMVFLGQFAKWIIIIGIILWVFSKLSKGKPSK